MAKLPRFRSIVQVALAITTVLLMGCASQEGSFVADLKPADRPAHGPAERHSRRTFLYIPNFSSNTISAFAVDSITENLTELPQSPLPSPIQHPLFVSRRPQSNLMMITNANDSVWISGDNVAFTDLDPSTGELTLRSTQTIPSLSILQNAWDNTGTFVYLSATMQLHYFEFQQGDFSLIEQPNSRYLVPNVPSKPLLHPSGNWLYSDNGSTLYVFQRNQTTGELRQIQAVDSGIGDSELTPDGNFLIGVFWKERKIAAYQVDQTTGMLNVVSVLPERGTDEIAVAQLAVHPSGKFVVHTTSSTNGLNPSFSGEVSVFRLEAESGTLTEVETSPFSAGRMPFTATFDPTGSVLYVVDQGPSYQGKPAVLLTYSFDSDTGTLTELPAKRRELGVYAAYPLVVSVQ